MLYKHQFINNFKYCANRIPVLSIRYYHLILQDIGFSGPELKGGRHIRMPAACNGPTHYRGRKEYLPRDQTLICPERICFLLYN